MIFIAPGSSPSRAVEKAPRYWKVEIKEVESVVERIFDPGRTLPIVAVSSAIWDPEKFWIDPEGLCRELAGAAEVVCFESGPATWELSRLLPEKFEVFGGAARIWWPGCSPDSNPTNHPLLFIYNQKNADKAHLQIRKILPRMSDRPAKAPSSKRWDDDPREVKVVSVGNRVRVRDDRSEGVLLSDLSQENLRDFLEPGQVLMARKGIGDDGLTAFSCQGLLAEPWKRIEEEYREGDVIWCRVEEFRDYGVFLVMLPGAKGLVHKSEIDWHFVNDTRQEFSPGQIVKALIQVLDVDSRRCKLSIKRALHTRDKDVKPQLSLLEGGPSFPSGNVVPAPAVPDENFEPQRIEELEGELASIKTDRRRLLDDHQRLKREKRSLTDRIQALDGPDPLSSEREFKRAIRIEHVRALEEADLAEYPLGKLTVGREFLESARQQAREGISAEKIVEVCMQVVCNRAKEINALEVHQFRNGDSGTDTRRRASDGAVAWRCSLQVKTASARRLHWWVTQDGVEFALVGVHDDFRMPK